MSTDSAAAGKSMKILVINCGSSSIKYQMYQMPEKTVLAKGMVEKIGEQDSRLIHQAGGNKHVKDGAVADHKAGMTLIAEALVDKEVGVISDISEIGAVGHRVVHGGETYSGSVIIDDDVIKCIEDFCDLAPLHNPPNLTGIREARALLPDVPMVAVFDTAFHQSIPPRAYMYALPYELYEKYRIRKYGFHGTSHAYVTHRAAEMLGRDLDSLNVITCHLGNGCSMAAVENGKSVDTTMGLTPLQGLVMGTRCGDIDAAITFYLMGKEEYSDYHSLDKLFNKKSGLLGLSGVSNDLRNISEQAARDGRESRAQLALDVFDYRLCFYIGAYMGVLPKVHAIIFTGGIGQNGAQVRADACKNLRNLGVYLDEEKNKQMVGGKEGDIATADSPVRLLVIPTDEEGWIATDTYKLCAG